MTRLTQEEYAEFDTKLHIALRTELQWRRGQCYFNVLYAMKPELANEIRGVSFLDPFYNDTAIDRFRERIKPE